MRNKGMVIAFVLVLGLTTGIGSQTVFEVEGPVFPGRATVQGNQAVLQGYNFNDGTLQGWTVYGPVDEDGHGPFASNFSASWADAVNYPTESLGETIGNNLGSYKICNIGGHGITNPGADWWYVYWFSPDLSFSPDWQDADGYTIKLLNAMDLIGAAPDDYLDLYINLRVTVWDHDLARERYFSAYTSAQAIETWNESRHWIELSYNWTGMYVSVPHRTIREVYVSVTGSMDDYFEGGIYLDEVQPITGGMVNPALSVSPTSLDFGLSQTTLTFDISNTGGGSLTWTAAESLDVAWITSVSPAFGTGDGTVTVTVDRAFVVGDEANAPISVSSNGGDRSVPVFIRNTAVSPWIHPEIETKIAADDAAAGDEFGQHVDVDGDYVIVGADIGNNAGGVQTGAAYIYHWDGTNWTQQAKLLPSDGALEDYFGYSVAISGDYAVVGSCWDDDGGDKSGSAYVFKRSGTTWTQQAKLVASDAGVDNRFGISAEIDGDYVLVGAFFDEDFGTRTGSAYVFKRSGTSWTQQAKLLASDAAANDWFGVVVSLDGNYAAIGSRYHDCGAVSDAGAVYVFRRDGTAWSEQQKLEASDGATSDLFHACSINGEWIAVGAYEDDDLGTGAGAVYMFRRDGDVWSEQQKLTAPDGAEEDTFGARTAINGDCLVAGAYLDDDNGKDSGSLYVFRYNGTEWQQETKIIATDGEIDDWFSLPVAIDDGWIASGARKNDDDGTNSGSVYIYEYESTSTVDPGNGKALPQGYGLAQNYPNPFNPNTSIGYSLARPATVLITIYDALGHQVAILEQGRKEAGEHTARWNGRNGMGQPAASGLYFYRLEVRAEGGENPLFVDLKKMIYLK